MPSKVAFISALTREIRASFQGGERGKPLLAMAERALLAAEEVLGPGSHGASTFAPTTIGKVVSILMIAFHDRRTFVPLVAGLEYGANVSRWG
jgi:hypothetical protein